MASQATTIALERFTSFGDLLKFLRRRAGLTQRELSIAVGYSHAQISRLELNERPPDLATITARFVPALDLEKEPAIAGRLVELAAARPDAEAPALGSAPFKGLQHFEETDAGLFFGREALAAHLLDRVREAASATPRFLAVVGASGSGKSSIVRAGLIPAVRRDSRSSRWPIYALTPTARPIQALAASLTHAAGSVAATASLMDDLTRDRRSLHLAAARLLAQSPAAHGEASSLLLLVIDQFEELFTQCRDAAERQAFVDNLVTAASEPGGAVFVVLTLRADFYPHCAPYPALRDALAGSQEYIGQMSSDELRRAIEEPAKRGNWELEPGLVEVLLQDVGVEAGHAPEPGALPLLSHALLETWSRRRGRTLTVSGYLASGGVRGAIAETADAVYHDQLDEQQQAIARNVFLRLTGVGEDESTADTRRRASFDELMRRPEDAPGVREVLTRLADARLITTDNEVAEVAHEALIREWRTLRGWIEEDREGLRLHRHLTLAADGWEQHDRDPGELYRGARLAQAAAWAEAHPGELAGLEAEFLTASHDLAGREEAEREAQRQRELEAAHALAETQRKAATQLRRRAIYLSGAFILALVMAGAALFLGERARQSAVTAQHQERVAFGRELAAAAINNLEIDPERSILLSLQAVSTTQTDDGAVLPEAVEALHRSILSSPLRMTLSGHDDWVLAVVYSPDGSRLASLEHDGTTIIWDAASGQELRRLPGATALEASWGGQRLAYSPDGRRLAVADSNLIKIYDPDSGELLATLAGHTADVWAVAFSPDGQRLASAGADTTARLWDAASGTSTFVLAGHTGAIETVTFSPDGKWVATSSDDGTAKIWDAASGDLLDVLSGEITTVGSIAFSPDGGRLATTSDAGLQVWQLTPSLTEETALVVETPLFTIEESLAGAVFSPDGAWVSSVSGSVIKSWDAQTGREVLGLAGHSNVVSSFAFSPDGTMLASSGLDETVKIWTLLPGGEAVTVNGGGWRVVYGPDGTMLATDGLAGTPSLWDANTGEPLHFLEGHAAPVMSVAFSSDGKRLATSSVDGTANVWDTASGQELLTLSGHAGPVRDVAFSPDGARIATASFDGTARLWDAATGQELSTLFSLEGLMTGVVFSPDGTQIATASSDKIGRLWDATTGELLFALEGHSELMPDIVFSPDGRKLATGSLDATAKIWDAATGAELLTLAGHTTEIQSVAFSPDGRLIATGSGDNTAKIWDASTGQELLTLPGNEGGVFGVAFSPNDNGAHLAVASTDGIVRVFLLNLDDLLALAHSRVTRALRPEECQRYLHVAECP